MPHTLLAARFDPPFTHIKTASDFGMAMASAVTVLAEQSAAAYSTFHTDWDNKVAQEAAELRALAPDLVLVNVPYLPLAGAALAGIPSAALCSLNWADIYRHYFGDDAIAAQIHGCYANADAFLRATPGMSMTNLPNLLSVAPENTSPTAAGHPDRPP